MRTLNIDQLNQFPTHISWGAAAQAILFNPKIVNSLAVLFATKFMVLSIRRTSVTGFPIELHLDQ